MTGAPLQSQAIRRINAGRYFFMKKVRTLFRLRHDAGPSLRRGRAFAHAMHGVLALCCALLAACAEPPQAPLRVGLNPWIGYDPLVLARDRGLTDSAVLRVVELESTSESIRQMRNGRIEAAGLTLADVAELSTVGFDLKVIGILSHSKGADAVLARAGIGSVAGLAGMRIGMEDSALSRVMLQRTLARAGLPRSAVHEVMLSIVDHAAALRAGRVDAVITFEPVRSLLASEGFPVLLSSADMPGEVIDVLAIRSDVLEARPQQASALLRAFEQGRRIFETAPGEAAHELAASAGLSEDGYLAALGNLRHFTLEQSIETLKQTPQALPLGLTELAEALDADDRMTVRADWTRLFDASVAERVLAEGNLR
jgi:NitT/TauT family transport system substrate-binding protein